MSNFISKYFEKRREDKEKLKFIMVHMMEETLTWSNLDTGKETGKSQITYYLHENGNGERKVDILITGFNKEDKRILPKETEIYRKEIYPWLSGVDREEIQSYNQALQGNVMTALKRKVP